MSDTNITIATNNATKKKQQEFISHFLATESQEKCLYFLLTCAISGHLEALNDFIEHGIASQYPTVSCGQVCSIVGQNDRVLGSKSKEELELKELYYKEMSYKMVTHCLLDTLLMDLNHTMIDETWDSNNVHLSEFAKNRKSLREEIIYNQWDQDQNTILKHLNSHYKVRFLYINIHDPPALHCTIMLPIMSDNTFKYNCVFFVPLNVNIIQSVASDDLIVSRNIDARKIESLKYGMNIYKYLINLYPILQFTTSFCRELPHLYALRLIEKSEVVEIVDVDFTDSIDDGKNGDESRARLSLSQPVEDACTQLFNKYATNKHPKTDELVMSRDDYMCFCCANGKVLSTVSLLEFVTKRVFSTYNQDKNENFLYKDSFFNIYLEPHTKKETGVCHDIFFQGLGHKLCQKKENLSFYNYHDDDSNSNGIKRDIYQLRCKFVNDLKETFVSRELILINYMIKISNMEKAFSTINNDIENLIVKMIHPLNINEKDIEISILDDKLRNHWKYNFENVNFFFNDFVTKDFKLMHQPFFVHLIKDLAVKYPYGSAPEMIEEMIKKRQDSEMDMVTFRRVYVKMLETLHMDIDT